jgi:CheY-like chemotaxis protein
LARKILLADDSVTAQNMGRKILADAGYDVSTVNNGSAALKRIAELKPDLIVLDVYMPGYSGLEVCQRLKDAPETAHIPVLLTVGKLEPFKPEEARRVRADAHIVKPFEASELLTAITRLEDRMVPQADGSRFSTSVSGLERFEGSGRKTESDGEADTGWKSRLRFPTKKKKEEKEEAEAEDVAAAATYRDFRKGKGKNGASSAFAVKAPAPPGQEPGLVPDIPRDITPEELDALSALVAKLDGPIPETENITPLADKAVEVVAEKTEVKVPAAEAKKEEQRLEAETSTSMVEPAATTVDRTIVAEATAGGGKSAVEIPVEHLEPKSEGARAVDEAARIEVHQS